MQQYIPIILFGVTILIVGLTIYMGILAEKKRTQSLSESADQLGLAFQEDPAQIDKLMNQYSTLQLFSKGRKKELSNLIVGETDQVELTIFDYSYVVGHGKNKRVFRQSVVGFDSKELNIPNFGMRPENFLDRFGSMVGFQDIDFDESPEYSAAFVLKSNDEASVRQLFDQELMDYFVTQSTYNIEACGSRVILYQTRTRIKPEQAKELLARGLEAYNQISNAMQRSGLT